MGIETNTPPPPTSEPPAIEGLVIALRSVTRKGLPVSPERSPEVLLAMRGVYARSINPDDYLSRVKALNLVLPRMLMELGEGEEAVALRTIFGLPAENRGLTLTERRRRASRALGYGETHFRKHIEERLLRDFAWFLHEDSQNYTPRSRKAPPRMEISGDTPSLTAADINEHEELVSRIWALVYELRAALIRSELEHLTDDNRLVARLSSLWLVGTLLNQIDAYVDRFGHSILHGGAEYEVDALVRLAGWADAEGGWTPARLRIAAARSDRDGFIESQISVGRSGVSVPEGIER